MEMVSEDLPKLICPHCGSLRVHVDGKRVFSYSCGKCLEKWAGRYVICGDDIIVDAKTGKFVGYGSIREDEKNTDGF